MKSGDPLTSESDDLPGYGPRFGAAELARLCAGLVALLLVVAALASWLRPELTALGESFVRRFGYAGMAGGTLIADAFHFPIPPQFYMLMAVTGGVSQVNALAAIGAGSLAGGYLGYEFSKRLGQVGFVARRLEGPRKSAERAFQRWGYRAAVMASLLPIAYSVVCYLAGLNRLPIRFFAVLAALRVPRLILFYYLVRLGWAGP
jgi:membrane protein YqaA with SNARE-associated domain